MEFGTGWISGLFASHDGLDASAAHLAAARDGYSSLTSEGGLSRDPWVVNQGSRESCTCEMGIRWLYAFTGTKCSSQIPWWAARLIDAPGSTLRNVGVSFQAFVEALERDGAAPTRPDQLDQYDPEATPAGVDRVLAQKGKLDVLEFNARGQDLVLAHLHALAQGLPSGAVIHSDDGYRRPIGGICGAETDSSAGLHAIVLWRFRKNSGHWEFMSPSSYGTAHGVNGIVWIPESRIASSPWGGCAKGLAS